MDETLKKLEEEIINLNQDELYDLLVECGIEGLKKVKEGEGKVELTPSE